MKRKANIFCASNPAKLSDALWHILSGADFSNDIIFLPSRRAVRTVERMIAGRAGGAAILPKLVALGEAADDTAEDEESGAADTVSGLERTIVLSKMLSAANGYGAGANMASAKDLIRMMDYLENEGMGRDIDWKVLVGPEFAEHFREKARFLDLAQKALPLCFPGRETVAQRRNSDIRSWINNMGQYGRIIVCGSTASVPATADLMERVAGLANGYIIFPGDVRHKVAAQNVCDPYFSEIKFLERVGVKPEEVNMIDVGESNIGFLNGAFSNNPNHEPPATSTSHVQRIDCARESEEAEVVAEIAMEKSGAGASVLIVSPDISAAQRLCESLSRRGANYDFSGGTKGSATALGRFILNLLDDDSDFKFYNEYKKSNLFDTVANAAAEFNDEDSVVVFESLKILSDILTAHGLELAPGDLRSMVAECLNGVSIRPPRNEGATISIVGTIESRMQTADTVILTGLNEGMFPAMGYENPWLPRRIADSIGLPPPERKVSLMALDFINLSCGPEIYWTRSKMSGGGENTESRFLSRIAVAQARPVMRESVRRKTQDDDSSYALRLTPYDDWLQKVRAIDAVPYEPLDTSAPRPPAINDDVYVTELELLIHNPYAFYARHILRLRPKDDPGREPGAKEFGILVHEVIEHRAKSIEHREEDIVAELDARAREILPADSILFHFWRKRFLEIAPSVAALLRQSIEHRAKSIDDGSGVEIPLDCVIAGRTVRARADMIIGDTVIDIKTGAAPNKKQLGEGNMPQLPLEAYMLRHRAHVAAKRSEDGYGIGHKTSEIVMKFVQLKNRDVRPIEYSGADAAEMINAAVQKAAELFGRYAKDGEPYEYRVTSDAKYKEYDDLARVE
ncbi:MAG: PD-(D/E)XK nuclease family protein [Alphaproteobacteria bacterium]|nr:PD-(D/E)XK nuclease family protein [Alphaproteobacteria bacterium]